jgi:hypothetical protein
MAQTTRDASFGPRAQTTKLCFVVWAPFSPSPAVLLSRCLDFVVATRDRGSVVVDFGKSCASHPAVTPDVNTGNHY